MLPRLPLLLALACTAFAETHHFEPKEFHNTFSGAHKPVLTIRPGDHVITSTIDARGIDSAGVKRGQGPNPQTGPFYIEGAEAGQRPSRVFSPAIRCTCYRKFDKHSSDSQR